MNDKRALVNFCKDIVLLTRVLIFCTALFTNNKIKVVIQIDAFLAHQLCGGHSNLLLINQREKVDVRCST
jgi:hypothetical protein